MTSEELRTIQLRELSILKCIIDICDRNNIKYYAAGGTMLGAARHQGFIPWDDDVDLAMMRKDYRKFIKIASKELPSELRLENYKLTPDKSKIPFLKVLDSETEVELNYASVPIRTNLFVDIFPYDGMPSGRVKEFLYKIRFLWLRLLRNYADFNNIHMYRPNRPLHERFLIKFGKLTKIWKLLDYYKLTDKSEKFAMKYSVDRNDRIISVYGAYKFREIMPKKYYGDGIKVPFEDIEINVPAEYKKVLSLLYGNYMELPPENQRHLHHNMKVIKL